MIEINLSREKIRRGRREKGGEGKRRKQCLRDLWYNNQRFNIPVIRTPEGFEKGQDKKKCEEIMVKYFPNLAKDINLTDSRN